MAAIYLLLSILAAFAGLVIFCLLRRVPLVLACCCVVFGSWPVPAVQQNRSTRYPKTKILNPKSLAGPEGSE